MLSTSQLEQQKNTNRKTKVLEIMLMYTWVEKLNGNRVLYPNPRLLSEATINLSR